VQDAGKKLIVARLLSREADVQRAVAELNARCRALALSARTAAFTSTDAAADVIRLATTHDVEVILLDAPHGLDAEHLPPDLGGVLERSPADVAILARTPELAGTARGIFVPFGGGENDWAALELGAALASAASLPVRLVGTKADPRIGRRDASRLLADAALAVQRVIGVETEPVLTEPTESALVAAIDAAALVVVGISPRWRREGIGVTRRALLRDARVPVLLVHRGPRPGGLAPPESRTRFTWSIEPEGLVTR
jgi:hypothetical protein